MKWLASKLVDQFIHLEIIDEKNKNNYIYGTEFLIMKLLGILVITSIGVLTHQFIGIFVFYIVFHNLRKYTNGYHSKKAYICVLETIAICTLICVGISSILMNYSYLLHFITIFSMLVIYMLAPVNSENITLSRNEMKEHREKIKYILLIDLIVLVNFFIFEVKLNLVVFFDLAIQLDLVLIIVGLVINKRKEAKYEKHQKKCFEDCKISY